MVPKRPCGASCMVPKVPLAGYATGRLPGTRTALMASRHHRALPGVLPMASKPPLLPVELEPSGYLRSLSSGWMAHESGAIGVGVRSRPHLQYPNFSWI